MGGEVAPGQEPLLPPRPDRAALVARFRGQPLSSLRTPAVVVDRVRLQANCRRMARVATSWRCGFRAHIKTLKVPQATRAMLEPEGYAGSSDGGGRRLEGGGGASGEPLSHAIVVSTLAEAWGVIEDSDLVSSGLVTDILYGMPVAGAKLPEFSELRRRMRLRSPRRNEAQLRLLVDHKAQLDALDDHVRTSRDDVWSVFVKVDCGYARAGIPPSTPAMTALLTRLFESPNVSLYGLYAHAGHSYASRSAEEAGLVLTEELRSVQAAAQEALRLRSSRIAPSSASPMPAEDAPRRTADNDDDQGALVLSVGSTPTARAAESVPSDETLEALASRFKGCRIELHAGNYPCLDLQQVATHAAGKRAAGTDDVGGGSSEMPGWDIDDVSLTVLATVVSVYPFRGTHRDGHDDDNVGIEALCDAGGIALSKDTGQLGGFGHVVEPFHLRGWELARISQEHGILRLRPGGPREWREQWGEPRRPASEDPTSDARRGDDEIRDDDREGADDADAAYRPRLAFPPRSTLPRVGERIRIVPQHACMVAANHPWLYVVEERDGGDEQGEAGTTGGTGRRGPDGGGRVDAAPDPEVVDVWVPWKGW